VARRYVLTLRREGATEKQRFESLDEALDALEQEARAFAATERREARRALMRSYDPVQLVPLRAALSGARLAAGVDVRGDGSAEAWTGRFRRSVLPQRSGESPYDALRRVLSGQPSGPSSAP
jgi:hypothetical protein